MKKMSLLTVAVAIPIILFMNGRLALGQGQVFWQANGVLICDGTRQGYVAIAEDGVDGAIIVWGDNRGTYESIYAQRVDKDGDCLWAPNGILLRTDTWYPDRISAVSDGRQGAIVVWKDRPNPSVPPQVRAQRVDSSGVVRWGPGGVIVASDTGDIDYWPAVVTDGRGGAIVAWVIEIIDTTVVISLHAQSVDSSGTLRWIPSGVLIASDVRLNFPFVAEDHCGGMITDWVDYRNGDWDVYAQRLDSAGVSLWGAAGVPVCTASGTQGGGEIASDTAGGSIIAWSDGRGASYDIYAQRVDSTGAAQWSMNGVAVCLADSIQRGCCAVGDGFGGVVVCWVDHRAGQQDIYAQRLDRNGDPQWDLDGVFVIMAVDTTAGYYTVPRSVTDTHRGCIISWNDLRSGNWDIYCQRVDSSGNLRWGTDGLAVCTDPAGQAGVVTVPNSDGGAIIAWADGRPPGIAASVYAQRVGDLVGVEERAKSPFLMTNDQLLQNFPNPFSQMTEVRYQLVPSRVERIPHTGSTDQAMSISLKVYDLAGRLIKTLLEGEQNAGSYRVIWDGRDGSGRALPSGIYFCELRTSRLKEVRKAVLIRN